jgi:hypothetical protein
MSLQRMRQAVRQAKLARGDREWFPRWLEQYARFRRAEKDERIPVSRDSLIEFLQSRKRQGRDSLHLKGRRAASLSRLGSTRYDCRRRSVLARRRQ